MTAYVDSSALLRLVLREPGALETLLDCEAWVSSELIAVEAARTVDRLRLSGTFTTDQASETQHIVTGWLDTMDLVLLRAPVLIRASQPLPSHLGTLDALHLASALVWQDRMNETLVFATHDGALGLAARAYGFEVVGL